MPILTRSGRVVIAEAIQLRPVHFAWGTGDNAWTTSPPAEDIDATALMNEIGRRTADEVAYVVPDEDGLIVLPSGSFTLSPTPTRHLYCRVRFGFTDAPTSVIRELAIFVGTETDSGLPPGQRYFLPAEITDPGRILHLEHFQPIYRSTVNEESFEVVITF
jgi:hypothetical protein